MVVNVEETVRMAKAFAGSDGYGNRMGRIMVGFFSLLYVIFVYD